ncbi:endonuclease 8-like 1 [Parambassis ranga]|uniref:Endonuclease 8-like 1 n=1 Tax=Parambassis ranga TaxID=210632 RepID=A0A6P7KJI1_9TELE|nr:endonuclease 8-like 1 [Parambassis ranga]
MPEGPELHLASLYVNKVCDGVVFTGPVRKSEVSKNPDVPFTCEAYFITATSRGKEVKLTLMPIKSDDDPDQRAKAGQVAQPMDVVFRFGMSGYFRFTREDELPKHAHLRFYTNEKPCRVLSFVDTRRFGSWQPNGTWQADRGPCVMFEYKEFRENIVTHLSDHAFDRPICEVLLNQKYFNGIGNYLRAEILFRLNIPPFVPARDVLDGLQTEDLCGDNKVKEITRKPKNKQETGDLLQLCHAVPLEVVNLGGKGYDPEKADYSGFEAWLQCYNVDGMKSTRDHNGRTMWFAGDPGPMAPKNSKSPKAIKRVKKEDHDYTDRKKLGRRGPESTTKKKAMKEEGGTKTTKKENKVCPKESKRKKNREVNAPQRETRSSTRRRKSSSADITAGSQRRNVRMAK